MARKSRDLRLSQTKALIVAYEAAGLGEDRNCRFAKDMQWRLERNKGLSPNRRKWLDSIIEEGVPAPKGDPELLAHVEASAEVEGMKEFDAKVLREFAGKIRRGWDLSPKQKTWLADLLSKADKLAANGPWVPDAETVEKLKLCVNLARGYSTVYWQTHGGTWKALESVKAFLEGTGHADEWCVNKLIKSMGRPLREIENPKFQVGEMRWLQIRGEGYVPALVAAGPFVSETTGHVVYSALVNGQLVETDRLTKARRK